jgi:RNA polymerase sigma-70 factor (ECF subfamily)
MNENTLVIRCINGDHRAQRALFKKFAPKMLGVCLRYVKEKTQAEDVLQDGFVKVFFKIKDYKGGSLEGWIRKIMVNTSLDQLRKDHKFKKNEDAEEGRHKIVEKSFIVEKLVAEDILEVIASMPVGYRTVFNMFAIEGYSHKDIAKELGVTETTSKTQYYRAREYLKKKIKEY